MANVRDCDTSLWLHNKLGTSNDSWTSGSICSQLNKEVLRNIKDCFPDLQTQVKLKLLLSFFHIPRRLVEEWKAELEEIIELAAFDSELWVSMIAETIKTFPRSGSLNTEISDYEETRPIFTDMVNDLRRLIGKHSDIGMLPLECQYLNKAALVSVVGQQPAPVKHFTIKKKPKSFALKAELLKKCADAQSQVKKTQAPTIPLRTRGMPRKMTDTTPLKGIPSRVPTGGGFRGTPTSAGSAGSAAGGASGVAGGSGSGGASGGTPGSANRPNLGRMTAGRKDGGIKLLDIAEQPLGYAALKKRKRQQELEDQQKRALEAQSTAAAAAAAAAATAAAVSASSVKEEVVTDATVAATSAEDGASMGGVTTPVVVVSTTPDYAAGLNATSIYTQPATPAPTVSTLSTPSATLASTTPSSTSGVIKDSQLLTIDTPVIIAGLNSPMHSPVDEHSSVAELQPSAAPAIIKFVKAEPSASPMKSGDVITIKSEPAAAVVAASLPQIVHVKSEPMVVTSAAPASTVSVLPVPQMMSLPTLGGVPKVTQKQKQQQQAAAAAALATNNSPTTASSSSSSQIIYMKTAPTIVSVANATQRIVTTSTNATPIRTPQRVAGKQQQRQQIVQQPMMTVQTPQQQQQASGATTAITTNVPKQPTLLQVPTSLTTQQYITPKLTAIGTKQQITGTPKKQKINIQSNIQVVGSVSGATTMPGLTALSLGNNSGILQQAPQLQQLQIPSQIGSTKIVQIKTTPTMQTMQQLAPQQQQPQQQNIQLQQQQQPQVQRIIVSSSSGQQQQNIPPLIATQPTILNIRNVSIAGRQQQQITTSNQPQQMQTTSASNISYITTTQQPQQQMQQQRIQIQQQPSTIQLQQSSGVQKFNQVLVSPTGKGNTIILSSNPNQQLHQQQISQQQQQQQQQQQPAQQQKTIILRSVGPDGKTIYQQVPLSSIAGMNIGTTTQNPPGLIKTQPQQIQIQQQQVQQLPALVPTSNYAQTLQNMPVVIQSSGNAGGVMPQLIMNSDQMQQQPQTIHIQQQQPSQQQQQQQQTITTTLPGNTIIRPVMQGGGLQMLPQGLTLIQRPGQQPQLVQTIQQQPQQQQQQQPQQIHRTIITQQPQQQQIQIRHQPQQQQQQIIIQQQTQQQPNMLTIQQKTMPQQIQIQQQQIVVKQQPQTVTVQQQQQQRTPPTPPNAANPASIGGQTPKSIKISTENIAKAQEMFRRANRLTRRDKALILSFMAGCRENPMPSADNSIVIKLNDSQEKVKLQGAADSTARERHVEAFIRLDYNTGKWSRFETYGSVDGQTGAGAGAKQVRQGQAQ